MTHFVLVDGGGRALGNQYPTAEAALADAPVAVLMAMAIGMGYIDRVSVQERPGGIRRSCKSAPWQAYRYKSCSRRAGRRASALHFAAMLPA